MSPERARAALGRYFVAAVVSGVVLVLSACGHSRDACAGVTPADAETILRQPVRAPRREGATCRYESVGQQSDVAALVVTLHEEPTTAKARDGFEAWKRMWGAGRPLSGMGEEAYLQCETVTGTELGTGTLSVLRGKSWIVLSVVIGGKKASLPALMEVAGKVAAGL